MSMVSSFLSRVPPLFSGLAKILDGDIDCSLSTLKEHSTDGSPYQITPAAVVYPKNSTDIKHVLSFAREYTMPISVRGNGTKRTGASLGEGISIDMSRHLTSIHNIDVMNNTITVDAGASVQKLREALHQKNFDIPFLTSSDNDSTIGGVIAAKNCTPTSFYHGTIREWIESLTIVVDTGEEHTLKDGVTPSGRLLGIYQAIFPLLTRREPHIRAAKPSCSDDGTGYNIWNASIGPRQLIDQLVGSEGTLAIITSVTLRIAPLLSHRITTCIPVSTTEDLMSYTNLAKEKKSDCLFFYDEAFSELVKRYYPNILPHNEKVPYTLLVTHRGKTEALAQSMSQMFIRSLPVAQKSITIKTNEKMERLTEKKFLYSLFDAYTKKTQTPISVADGLIVSSENYKDLLTRIDSYLYSLGKLYTITGNIGSGHISVVTLFDQKSPQYAMELTDYTQTIFSYVQEYKGGISASGGEGLSRTPFLSYVYNEATRSIFKEVKDAWDPFSILNPDKKITISQNYLKERLKQVYEE